MLIVKLVASLLALSLLAVIGIIKFSDTAITEETLSKIYPNPLAPPTRQLTIFHLGHSLVGRDMPAMLKQLAGNHHNYHSQLGWGTPLQAHWEPDTPIKGFKTENAHSNYRDVFQAIDSQKYDIFILTEMVEIKSAIQYFDSSQYLAKFADYIHSKRPNARIYLYETWNKFTDEKTWLKRLDTDYKKYWLSKILDIALSINDKEIPIYVIPAGQVLSALFKALETEASIEGLSQPRDIFAQNSDGTLDTIHINDIGNYLVALVHYAVLYQKSPLGLPHELKRADGSMATPPSKEAAELMQKITWNVVSNDFRTGLIGLQNL